MLICWIRSDFDWEPGTAFEESTACSVVYTPKENGYLEARLGSFNKLGRRRSAVYKN